MASYPTKIFENQRAAIPFCPPPRLVNPLMNLDLSADPIVVTTSVQGVISHNPAADRNPDLDNVFDCSRLGNDGLPVGILPVTVSILGTWLNVGIEASPIVVTPSIEGSFVTGVFFSSGVDSKIGLSVTIGGGGTYSIPVMTTSPPKANWVKWSNIGSIDFTVWKDNIAGERPLDWKGTVYGLKKLGNKVVAYGENGVSFLVPSGNTYGLQTVQWIGLKGKNAFCGNDLEHFYIDREGRLYRVADSVELLDYSEFLDLLGSGTVMSLDEENKLIYICDGTYGFVYSIPTKSLGAGPVNVTGIGTQGGITYVVAPATIVNPVFEICTDIYDLGSRKNKTISSLEIGTDATGDLWATIDYRLAKASSFSTLAWHLVNPNGIVAIPCFGVEFRFRLKRTVYAYFELDYIRVNGVIHNYSYLDSLAERRGA